MQSDMPLPVYAQQRRIFDDVIAEAMKDGDDPAIVAKVIVSAATDSRPSCATPPADGRTCQHAAPHRPRRTFDRQIRKLISWPADARPQSRQQGTPAGAAFPQDAGTQNRYPET